MLHRLCTYFAVFLVVVPSINEAGKLRCIYGDRPICGNDGVTYLNLCDFQIIRIVHPYLQLRHFGQCAPGRNQLMNLYQQNIKTLESSYGGFLRKRRISNKKKQLRRPHDRRRNEDDYLEKNIFSKLFSSMFNLNAFNFNMENNTIGTSGNSNFFHINFGDSGRKKQTPVKKRYEDEAVREVELPN